MQAKTPYYLILAGFLIDLVGSLWSLWGVVNILLYKPEYGAVFGKFFGTGTMSLFDLAIEKAIISVISGLILSLIMIFLVVRVAKNPTKKVFITTIVFSVIGIVTMHFGGVLELIGAIIGLNKLKNPE